MASRGRDEDLAGQSTSSSMAGRTSSAGPKPDRLVSALLRRLAPYTMSSMLEEGSFTTFYGADISHPGLFYIIPTSTWDQFQRMTKELQDYYTPDPPVAIPIKELLSLGMEVVVLHEDTWRRARILKILPENKYKVFMFDHGVKLDVPQRNIRIMDNVVWTEEEKTRFRTMISNQTLVIHLLKGSLIEGEIVWDVFLHILGENVMYFSQNHVERVFFKEMRGVDLTQDEEKRKRGLTTDREITIIRGPVIELNGY